MRRRKINIFILSENPSEAAKLLCDKHAGGKMAVESAQMLSTAHRVLDGQLEKRKSKTGKNFVKYYVHPTLEDILYKAVHHNHPCTIWTALSSENYKWHYNHFVALCDEYTYRYGKIHKTDILLSETLSSLPKNIKIDKLTKFALAMNNNPECIYEDDVVKSYRLYYQTKKERFDMKWTKRNIPAWFK